MMVYVAAPYVKVYLVNGKKCIAKAKTSAARRTLEPLYQQHLFFREPYQGCILQVYEGLKSVQQDGFVIFVVAGDCVG